MYRLCRNMLRTPAFRIGIACVVVLVIGSWGMRRELQMIEASVIKSQVSEVRSNAERTIIHLEQDLFRGRGKELEVVLREAHWLADLWDRTKNREPRRVFRAVLDASNRVLCHTDPERVGGTAMQFLEPAIDDPNGISTSAFRRDSALTDVEFVEIRMPIKKFRREMGYYVSGISRDWIQSKIRSEQLGTIITWVSVIGCTMSVVALTGLVLYRLAKRAASLEKELDSAETRRLSELSMLLVGMAHEVRNPLNSIRLNLHTSERVFLGEAFMRRDEVLVMLAESVKEVERVNEIISQLLGLARQEKLADEYAHAASEVDSAIQFFRTTFEAMRIGIQFDNRAGDALVAMDRARFRQILLNLITNAQDALPLGGEIQICLESDGESARLTIADSGKGVDEGLQSRIFEPFVTTRENGTGLGLSVVKSIVEQVGGGVSCARSARLGGAEFLLSMPQLVSHP